MALHGPPPPRRRSGALAAAAPGAEAVSSHPYSPKCDSAEKQGTRTGRARPRRRAAGVRRLGRGRGAARAGRRPRHAFAAGPDHRPGRRAGDRKAAVTAALDQLYADRQIQLFVTYVRDFSGRYRPGLGRRHRGAERPGPDDVLLAVATHDRQYAYSADHDSGLTEAQLRRGADRHRAGAAGRTTGRAPRSARPTATTRCSAGRPCPPRHHPRPGGPRRASRAGESGTAGDLRAAVVAVGAAGALGRVRVPPPQAQATPPSAPAAAVRRPARGWARRSGRTADPAAGTGRAGPGRCWWTTDDAVRTSRRNSASPPAQFGEEAARPVHRGGGVRQGRADRRLPAAAAARRRLPGGRRDPAADAGRDPRPLHGGEPPARRRVGGLRPAAGAGDERPAGAGHAPRRTSAALTGRIAAAEADARRAARAVRGLRVGPGRRATRTGQGPAAVRHAPTSTRPARRSTRGDNGAGGGVRPGRRGRRGPGGDPGRRGRPAGRGNWREAAGKLPRRADRDGDRPRRRARAARRHRRRARPTADLRGRIARAESVVADVRQELAAGRYDPIDALRRVEEADAALDEALAGAREQESGRRRARGAAGPGACWRRAVGDRGGRGLRHHPPGRGRQPGPHPAGGGRAAAGAGACRWPGGGPARARWRRRSGRTRWHGRRSSLAEQDVRAYRDRAVRAAGARAGGGTGGAVLGGIILGGLLGGAASAEAASAEAAAGGGGFGGGGGGPGSLRRRRHPRPAWAAAAASERRRTDRLTRTHRGESHDQADHPRPRHPARQGQHQRAAGPGRGPAEDAGPADPRLHEQHRGGRAGRGRRRIGNCA